MSLLRRVLRQSRRGGTSTPVIPSDASIVLHGSDLTSGAVTRWSDNRDAALNPSFYQATGTNQGSVATVGGNKALQFDGVNDFYQCVVDGSATAGAVPSTILNVAEFTFFAVFYPTAMGSAATNSAFTVAGHLQVMAHSTSWYDLGYISSTGIAGGFFDSANRQPADQPITLNAWNIIRVQKSAAHVATVQTNNNAAVTANGTGNVGANTGVLRLGGSVAFAGAIASIVVFKRSLTAQEIADVNSVLASRYGVTVP